MKGLRMKKKWVLVLMACSLFGMPLRADMVSTIAKMKSSVVIVGTYKATSSPRFSLRGTGFVVGNGNMAITNAHVLPESKDVDLAAELVIQIKIGEDKFQVRPVTVLDIDVAHDLALLQFTGPALPAASIGNSDDVREGQLIAFMGYPIGGALGFSAVTHRGMISSIAAAALPTPSSSQLNAKMIRSLRGGSFDIFQLDGTAYPGNSGGPLFDPDSAEVLGVVNMVFIKGTRESALTHPSGITYAIPSKYVTQLLQGR
jgi:serine protease Do